MRHLKKTLLMSVAITLIACAPAVSEPRNEFRIDPTVNANKTLITFGSFESARSQYVPLIEAFAAENPDIEVRFVALDGLIHTTTPTTAEAWLLRSRAVAEQVDTVDPGIWLAPAHSYDLAPLIAADAAFDQTDFYPTVQNAFQTEDGRIDRLPATVEIPVLAYNKTLFTAQGIVLPTDDWSWFDMRTAAEQLALRNVQTIERYGLLLGSPETTALIGELHLVQPELTQRSFAPADIDAVYTLRAIEDVQTLITSGALFFPPQDGFNLNQQDVLAQNGAFAMWDMRVASPPSDASFEVGFVPFPPIPDPFLQSSSAYKMSAGTRYPEAAWRWLTFLSHHYIRQNPHRGSIELPARQSVAEQTGILAQLQPELATAVQTTVMRPSMTTRALQEVALRLAEPVRQIIYTEARPVEVLAEVRQQIETSALSANPADEAAPIRPVDPAPANTPDISGAATTTIRFGAYGANQTLMQQIAQEFMYDNPTIAVRLTDPQQAEFGLEYMATINDCFLWPQVPQTMSVDSLLDLRPLLDAASTVRRDDYPGYLIDQFERNGRLYGMPLGFTAPVLAYDRVLFEQQQQAPPGEIRSGVELTQLAQRLTLPGPEAQYGFAIGTSSLQSLRLFLALEAVRLPDQQPETAAFLTEPALEQALQLYIQLLQTSSPHTAVTGYAREQPIDTQALLFPNQRVAMWFTELPLVQERYAISPLPLSTTDLLREVSSTGFVISADSADSEACWAWFAYLSNRPAIHEALDLLFPARHMQTPDRDAFTDHEVSWEAVYQRYTSLLQRDVSIPSALTSDTGAIDYFWLYRAVDRALQGADLAAELADAQIFTEQYLACVQSGEAPGACARQVDPTYAGFAQ